MQLEATLAKSTSAGGLRGCDSQETIHANTHIVHPHVRRGCVAGSLGQFLYQSRADRTSEALTSYLLNPLLLGGVACYIGVMVLFVAAFKREEP